MGHLLASVNPEAAAAIRPEPIIAAGRVPYIGEPVIYFTRPGEGRSGRNQFPALVLDYRADNDSADLVIFFAADDIGDRFRCQRRTTENASACWDFRDEEGGEVTRAEYDQLRKDVYGASVRPDQGALDYIYEIIAEVKAMREVIKAQATALTAMDEQIKTLGSHLAEVVGVKAPKPKAKATSKKK